MSDLQKRNTQAMVQRLKQVDARLDEQAKTIVKQNASIATLTARVAELQQQVVLMAVERRAS